MIPPPPRSTLFPYTTLFRSGSIQRWLEKNLSYIDFVVPIEDALTADPIQAMFCGPIARMRQALDVLAASKLAVTVLRDRKSTRLNSSHRCISYAVFCLKKKK